MARRPTRHYQVILSTGVTIQMPTNACRSEAESIRKHGLQAVLARVRRTRVYKAEALKGAQVRTIVCPNGTEVTQSEPLPLTQGA